ncbi:hypothetical protein L1049_017559 [Liquidambar formosana]|uniref:SWIM-type domain-containing protein n=1 Tax=Liquidambar formosana TaxID=63359 RepID=A0AAP0X7F7_LIQFO
MDKSAVSLDVASDGLVDNIADQRMEANHNVSVDYTPRLGLEFFSEDAAHNFYNMYGRMRGFSIRKEYANKNKQTGVLTSRKFACCKEGFRVPDKRDDRTNKPRAETRTGCDAHMVIKWMKEKGKFQVTGFIEEHNHPLHITACAHMMPSQRKITEAQAFKVDLANDSGITLKSSYEYMGKQSGGRNSLGYTQQDQKNYLRSKRQRDLQYGEAGSLLKYFQQQTLDNPSFYYAMQLDINEQITNIFWADAKMIIDYSQFGDVMTFDTTYRTNKEYRPFAAFVGFNHYRETVLFGAALLCDETAESFQWLFETFFTAMSRKKPQTIFTDQDPAMAKAILSVMPETYHRICTWHMMQNAIKHLGNMFKGDCTFNTDFSACIYEYEEEDEFCNAWEEMLVQYNLVENNWLHSILKIKEKWAKAYVRRTFSAGMRSTQLSESLNSDLRNYLNSDLDIVQFFKHFERKVNNKRYKELIVEYNSRQKLPRVKIKAPMLTQLAGVYTTPIFEEFQKEYEEYQGAFIKDCQESPPNQYMIGIYGQPIVRMRKVICNPMEHTVSCSCRKFETEGILCSHALKVLDVMNIKLIPEQYILKRWTKDARDGSVQDLKGRDVQADTKLQVTSWYRILCPNLVKLASRAGECEEAFNLVAKYTNEVSRMVEDIIRR